VGLADWTEPTIDSWRHSIWVGVFDPWIVVFKGFTKGPQIWYKVRQGGVQGGSGGGGAGFGGSQQPPE
jgi:hypothetical protein